VHVAGCHVVSAGTENSSLFIVGLAAARRR
jgi:hypothetical protein